jgi:hypothetical protein
VMRSGCRRLPPGVRSTLPGTLLPWRAMPVSMPVIRHWEQAGTAHNVINWHAMLQSWFGYRSAGDRKLTCMTGVGVASIRHVGTITCTQQQPLSQRNSPPSSHPYLKRPW